MPAIRQFREVYWEEGYEEYVQSRMTKLNKKWEKKKLKKGEFSNNGDSDNDGDSDSHTSQKFGNIHSDSDSHSSSTFP